MAQIKEEYVSFETAKLMKEKGFDQNCATYYLDGQVWRHYHGEVIPKGKQIYAAPTQAMAMKWLREKYNIYISIQPDFQSDKDYKMCWCWSVSILHENCIDTKGYQCYIETYEEACEAAIKYCLTNLI